MLKIFTCVFILLSLLLQSCGNKQDNKNNNTDVKAKSTTPSVIKLELPLNGSSYIVTDNIEIKYKLLADSISIDSAVLSINGKQESVFTDNSYLLPLINSKMGMQRALLKAYSLGKQVGTLSFVYTVKPQNPPKSYTYQIVKEYPHSTDAYTQGLFFHDGYIYEGTGQNGKSALRKINIQSGEVLKNVNLDAKYFGEGICLFDNRIYQLTWQDRIGFVYNAETFEKISDFNYSTEGWGITTDGTYLIMSDGTANLYFLNPENMSVIKQIEAYSNTGAIDMLNELEYIDGEIWANIYSSTDNKIVRIDPETGEVKGIINLNGILKSEDYTKNTDVFNGIAYDIATKQIFVTGKNWPKLFEIKIIAK